ncbi:SLATT domain-containing protein [Paracoccus sp. J39]|uniref:SLATT domain-containing protein n=1 Tax=Paracoccus sp. J39 TaxID=935848 RepID=UPI0012EB7A5B|nr:SLATT domain-containing protein [Paracoccus sp. J39]
MEDEKHLKLLLRMKRTKSNRFNYSKRLARKATVKSLSVNFLSLLCIFASIYLLASPPDAAGAVGIYVSILVTTASVVSLMLSVENPVSELMKRSQQAHQCARDISGLYGKFQAGAIEYKDARNDYESILNAYDDNHDECDNWKTLFENAKDFPGDADGIGWIRGWFLYLMSCYSPAIYTIVCVIAILLTWRIPPLIKGYFF